MTDSVTELRRWTSPDSTVGVIPITHSGGGLQGGAKFTDGNVTNSAGGFSETVATIHADYGESCAESWKERAYFPWDRCRE